MAEVAIGEAAGATALGYDGRGNLTSSGSSSYGYTPDNQLATAPGANLAYDPVGRLFNGNLEPGSNTTLVYDGADVIAELDQNNPGGVIRRYVYGPGTDEPLVWYEGAGLSDRRWLHADERGSIVEVTNGSGTALAVNTYDEYGIPGAGNLGRFQYTGQKWLPSIGMYDYKARMYSATLGRFMQTDPIGYADGLNWYDYVGGDPVNKVDPSGLGSCRQGEYAIVIRPAKFVQFPGGASGVGPIVRCASLSDIINNAANNEDARSAPGLPADAIVPQDKQAPKSKVDVKTCAGKVALAGLAGGLNPVGLIIDVGGSVAGAKTRTSYEDGPYKPNEPRLQRGWGSAIRIGLGRVVGGSPQVRAASAAVGAGLALLSEPSCGIGALPTMSDILPPGF